MIPRLSPSFNHLDLFSVLQNHSGKDDIASFEDALITFTGRRHALAFPMARSGLFALIKALGWHNREIIVPAYTCAVVPNAIMASGNRPVFVDVDANDFNMRADLVHAALSPKTVAVVATHMYGFPMDLDALADGLADRNDIMVIQDCALGLGTSFSDQPVHQKNDVAMFSFSLGKQISTVEGGMLTFDDTNTYESVKKVRDEIFSPPPARRYLFQYLMLVGAHLGLTPHMYPLIYALKNNTNILNAITNYFKNDEIVVANNFFESMPSFLARLGILQLEQADELLAIRKRNSLRLMKTARQQPGLECPTPRAGSSWSHVPCLVEHRGAFITHMAKYGVNVGTEVFDYALPEMPVYEQFSKGTFNVAKRISLQIATLPNHPRLRPSDLDQIEDGLRAWRGSAGMS